jgi:hypothetical protein
MTTTHALLGSRFATWLTMHDGELAVVKSMDVAPPHRETSPCWREFLGWRLGTRLGLAVPVTQLDYDPCMGRISVQRFIAGARPSTAAEFGELIVTRRGFRILALDFVARNPDRRPENVLVRGDVVFPIDFNVAFDHTGDTLAQHEVNTFVSRMFQVDGIGRLVKLQAPAFVDELRRAEQLLSYAYLAHAVDGISSVFITEAQREELIRGLNRRRDALVSAMQQWWAETVLPLQRLLGGIA